MSNDTGHDVQLKLLLNKAVSCKLNSRGLNEMDAIVENTCEEGRLAWQRDVDIPKAQYFEEDFAMRLARLGPIAGVSYFLGIRELPRTYEVATVAARNHHSPCQRDAAGYARQGPIPHLQLHQGAIHDHQMHR